MHDSVKYNKLRLLESTKKLMFERKIESIPPRLIEGELSCFKK